MLKYHLILIVPCHTLVPDPVLLFTYSAQLLPFILSQHLHYLLLMQASLVSAELLLQQTEILNYSNIIFLNIFLVLKSYIDFS